MKIRQFKASDTREAAEIWNSVVKDGLAFPQMEILSEKEALAFFQSQSYSAVAENPATGLTKTTRTPLSIAPARYIRRTTSPERIWLCSI